jgi:hypothetical protein
MICMHAVGGRWAVTQPHVAGALPPPRPRGEEEEEGSPIDGGGGGGEQQRRRGRPQGPGGSVDQSSAPGGGGGGGGVAGELRYAGGGGGGRAGVGRGRRGEELGAPPARRSPAPLRPQTTTPRKQQRRKKQRQPVRAVAVCGHGADGADGSQSWIANLSWLRGVAERACAAGARPMLLDQGQGGAPQAPHGGGGGGGIEMAWDPQRRRWVDAEGQVCGLLLLLD